MSTTILALLISALSLLSTIQSTPNLPADFVDKATAIANQAIEMAKVQTSSVQVSQPVSQPVTEVSTTTPLVFGSTCSEKPSIDLTASTTDGHRYFDLKAVYTTGCPIPKDLKWSYKTSYDSYSGTISEKAPLWYQRMKITDNSVQFEENELTAPFSITFGSTTKEL